jgi:hypothetical protein
MKRNQSYPFFARNILTVFQVTVIVLLSILLITKMMAR